VRRFAVILLVFGLVVIACSSGDDSSDETGATATSEAAPDSSATAPDTTETAATTTSIPTADSGDFRIATYNTGLAPGFVPLLAERQPLVGEAIADLDADVVFVQEVWTPESVSALREATSSAFPETVFPEPIPDTEPGAPACTVDELADLLGCIEQNCADASPDELVECVLSSCGAQFGELCEECQTCIGANVGNTVEEAVANCTTASSAFAYEGSVGIGLLSNAVIQDSDVLVLDSSLNRRAVLHAVVDTEAFGPVHVFGTHLSAVFSDIPYPDEGTWEQEQATQIADLLAYIDSRAEPGDPVVLLGDFNTGPAGERYQAEVAANYDLLTAAMFANPYTDDPEAECTFCGDNPLVGGDAAVVIDHVLTRGVEGPAAAERILDGSITVSVDGADTPTALSDHYGVMLTLSG